MRLQAVTFAVFTGTLLLVGAYSGDLKTQLDKEAIDAKGKGADDVSSAGDDTQTETKVNAHPSDVDAMDKKITQGIGFGKRFSNGLFEGFLNNQAADNIIADINDVDAAGPVDDKRWVLPGIYGAPRYHHRINKREVPEKRFIHYYGNMLGRGFSLGKRADEVYGPEEEMTGFDELYDDDGNEIDKRAYGGMLGRGFAFGKRRYFTGGPRRNFFGSVLGRGFSFGKRGAPAEELDAMEASAEGESESEDKNADNGKEIDEILKGDDAKGVDKRYIYGSPGYRFMFGKRSGYDMDKRYGYLFSRPFSSGKKRFLNFYPKRPYGFVLGNGFSLGKRSGDADFDGSFDDDLPDEFMDDQQKRSFLLGKGFMFGKRGMKRLGYVLGGGWKVGKRSFDDSDVMDSINDVFVVDQDGSVYKIDPDELNDLEPIADAFDEIKDNSDEDKYDLDVPDKRAFGLVLGRGFSYGKRAPSWKRFGHILGGGFSFGK